MKGVPHNAERRWPVLWRSFATKLTLLSAIFIAVPIVLYVQLRTADDHRTRLLLGSVQKEARLIAVGLKPLLQRFDGKSAGTLASTVERFGVGSTNVKLLFRPDQVSARDNFFYVASSSAVSPDYLEKERSGLMEMGVLDRLSEGCEGSPPATARYTNPAGEPEIVTSVVPIKLASGCWVVVTSQATPAFIGSSIGRPYWKTPEIRVAATIYVLMAAIVIWLFADAWRSLRRFQRLAHDIRTTGTERRSFAALNRVPELGHVAAEFDRLVHALGASGKLIREAAEENAHALKAPLAVVSQALEPLKKSLPRDDRSAQRALHLIERSVVKLDSLVSAARRMDEAIAELIDPPRQTVDLSGLIAAAVAIYEESWKARDISIEARIESGISVVADPDLLEAALDNLFDNAQSFSPEGACVAVSLSRNGEVAELKLDDSGPGVAAENLDLIFQRYFSARPSSANTIGSEPAVPALSGNFGIGLWIVRRNIEAFGGAVSAENRPAGGLRITLSLPLS